MTAFKNTASRFGARLGNWNDSLGYGGTSGAFYDAGRRWRIIDRVAGWLFTWPDR